MTNSNKQTNLGKQALVIGASMSGLLAARVLTNHFEQVTLIERDTLPEDSSVRNGVPQGKHAHLLLIRGQQSLERFFPNFITELDRTGAPYVQWMTDVNFYLSRGWVTRDDLNIVTRTTTRPNLEHIVRNELSKLPNVNFIENCQVDDLVMDSANTRVIGLTVALRPSAGKKQAAQPEVLTADLIVDASGRNSKLPELLELHGYSSPTETHVDSKLGYASRIYSRLSSEPDWKILGLNPQGPDQPRGGAITLQENGKWMVTLVGYGSKNQPPTDPDEFLAYAKSLPSPEVYDVLKTASPLTDISGYAKTSNVWHHYERLKRFPAGLYVLGDALCCFNPAYGQGMTTAALAAEVLDQCLSEKHSPDTAGIVFQKRLAKVIAAPWLLSTGSDFQFPETEGQKPGGITGVAQEYLKRLLSIIHEDVEIATAFIQVLNMVSPATALFSPALVVKVLLQSMRYRSASLQTLSDNSLG